MAYDPDIAELQMVFSVVKIGFAGLRSGGIEIHSEQT